MTHPILDTDAKLKEFDLENEFELLIHYPEQILQAWDLAAEIVIKEKINKITIYQNNYDLLFFYWLKSFINDHIELNYVNEYYTPQENELVISTIFSKSCHMKITQRIVFEYFSKKLISKELDLSKIPSIDGKSVFIGAISRVIDNSNLAKTAETIKHLVAILVQKAGALTWRIPAERNFAKLWAIKISESGLKEVVSFNDDAFMETAKIWQDIMFHSGIKKGSMKIMLSTWQQKHEHDTNIELIFSDGKNKLEMLATFFQLALVTSVYCKLLTTK